MNKTERLVVIANLTSAARHLAIGQRNVALVEARIAVRKLEPQCEPEPPEPECDANHGVNAVFGARYCPRCGVALTEGT